MAGLDGAQATYCTGSCHRRWGRGAVTLRKGFALSLGNNRCENHLSHLISYLRFLPGVCGRKRKRKLQDDLSKCEAGILDIVRLTLRGGGGRGEAGGGVHSNFHGGNQLRLYEAREVEDVIKSYDSALTRSQNYIRFQGRLSKVFWKELCFNYSLSNCWDYKAG